MTKQSVETVYGPETKVEQGDEELVLLNREMLSSELKDATFYTRNLRIHNLLLHFRPSDTRVLNLALWQLIPKIVVDGEDVFQVKASVMVNPSDPLPCPIVVPRGADFKVVIPFYSLLSESIKHCGPWNSNLTIRAGLEVETEKEGNFPEASCTVPVAYWNSYFMDSSLGKRGMTANTQTALGASDNSVTPEPGRAFHLDSIAVRLTFGGTVRRYLQEEAENRLAGPQLTLRVGPSERTFFANELLSFNTSAHTCRRLSPKGFMSDSHREATSDNPLTMKIDLGSGLLGALEATQRRCVGTLRVPTKHDGFAEITVFLLGTKSTCEEKESEVCK